VDGVQNPKVLLEATGTSRIRAKVPCIQANEPAKFQESGLLDEKIELCAACQIAVLANIGNGLFYRQGDCRTFRLPCAFVHCLRPLCEHVLISIF
jgi:hypothetical protein